jgi:hypothetical protein
VSVTVSFIARLVALPALTTIQHIALPPRMQNVRRRGIDLIKTGLVSGRRQGKKEKLVAENKGTRSF